MADFEGVVPAVITPMDAKGDLNEEAFGRLLESNIEAGVDGFWLAGGSGESILLSDHENRQIARIAAGVGKGRVKNIMHVGAPTTERSIKLAEHAAEMGIDAICCVPPFFYRQGDEAIVEHFRAVAAAADLPLFVYNLPRATGVEITPDLMAKIQDKVPQLKGLKHSAATFAFVHSFSEMGLSCFIGSAVLFLPALTIGAVGFIDGPPCVAPELWVGIWKSFKQGDMEDAMSKQRRAYRLLKLIQEYGFVSPMKALAGRRIGMDCGSARLPGPALPPELLPRLFEEADEILR